MFYFNLYVDRSIWSAMEYPKGNNPFDQSLFTTPLNKVKSYIYSSICLSLDLPQ